MSNDTLPRSVPVTVIVTGGRTYSDAIMVDDVLSALNIAHVIQGGAFGADKLAREWAQERKVSYATVDADWSLGRKAGPLRNRKMLEMHPDAIVVAFPGGRGTADCVRQAIELNRVVLEVK